MGICYTTFHLPDFTMFSVPVSPVHHTEVSSALVYPSFLPSLPPPPSILPLSMYFILPSSQKSFCFTLLCL